MIYTLTFNPCLDYTMYMPELRTGSINRSLHESCSCGGKGINVSLVLRELGMQSVALGFAAGFSGNELERRLRENGVDTDLVHLPHGMTRINVKLRSGSTCVGADAPISGKPRCGTPDSGAICPGAPRADTASSQNRGGTVCETDINGAGPEITDDALDELLARLDTLGADDVLVLSGSVPPSLPGDTYLRLLARLDGRGIQTVLDASGELLRSALAYSPFLIKPNSDELGELFGTAVETPEQCLEYARRLQAEGARNVLVSMGGDGSVLLTEDGTALRAPALHGRAVNTVGAGDSMVAGFVSGYLTDKDYASALRLGTAAGAATAFSEGLGRGEQIKALLCGVEVISL